MNSLLITDLHLTDNPRDEYRWALFPWLREACRRLDVKELFICGDLTDAKDRHSAKLVNRIVDELMKTQKEAELLAIWLLQGNHDGIDPGCAYFKFLGRYPYIKHIATPFQKSFDGVEVLMLPHTRDPLKAWEGVEFHSAEIILMHATIRGALAENGQALDGIPPDLLRTARRAKIFSGDVHVPQKCGNVEYIGAPYPVRFGDDFKPRAILSKRWRAFESIEIPHIHRLKLIVDGRGTLQEFKGRVKKGDQIKVIIRLKPSEYHLWNQLKKDVMVVSEAIGAELCGLELEKIEEKGVPKLKQRGPVKVLRSPSEALAQFCKAKKVSGDLAEAGQAILNEVKQGE